MNFNKIFCADFETTVYAEQKQTDVWAAAIVELGGEDVKIYGNIANFIDYLFSLKENIIVYMHNLKFDGSFIVSYLIKDLHMEQAIFPINEDGSKFCVLNNKKMRSNTFKYSVTSRGIWYTITVKKHNKIIEFRDSLKILPFNLRTLGKTFQTNHQKLTMKYEGLRYPNCKITDKEKEYIKNDVLVLSEALQKFFAETNNKKLTIGSACLEEYKKGLGEKKYDEFFPDLSKFLIDNKEHDYGALNADEYIRRGYRGGWVYLNPKYQGRIIKNCISVDVNSLYPSVMVSESGNKYPVGFPVFWHGNFIPLEARSNETFYYIRIKTRFELKSNYLPFIQIKNNLRFNGRENLTTSDYKSKVDGKYYQYYKDKDSGEIRDTAVTLTLSQVDFELLKKHYNLTNFEILDGCYFLAKIGLFDEYLNHYKDIKQNSKGARRTIAKLFSNNLYGKLSSNDVSSFKYITVDSEGVLRFLNVDEHLKKCGHIAAGAAVTSYARAFTITAAQKNYKKFIYADTDSLHGCFSPEELQGVKIHPTNYLCWKCEISADFALYLRPKAYIEHVVKEDLQAVKKPYYKITCAGMPDKCKHMLIDSFENRKPMTEIYKKIDVRKGMIKLKKISGYRKYYSISEKGRAFVRQPRTIEDFQIGLIVPDKLVQKQICGGVVLMSTDFTLRDAWR